MTGRSKKHRIKSRSRFTLFVALSIVFLVVISNTILGMDNASSMTEEKYMEISVKAGDTLWAIAGKYMPDSKDIRRSVYTLCETNGISADELMAGQVLLVPVN